MFRPYLRLMRFPLVFTAIGDALAVAWMGPYVRGPWGFPPVGRLAMLAGVSACLYGFGMVLNDALDAKRDALTSPNRPIPSGQVRPATALWLAAAFAAGAVALAVLLSWRLMLRDPGVEFEIEPLFGTSADVAVLVVLLIILYNGGLKRLPLLGLVLLGLIRAVQCQLPAVAGAQWNAPIWNSLFLFTHVTVISWIAYNWENKQPAVGRWTRWALAFAIVLIDLAIFDAFGLKRVVVESAATPESIASDRFLVLPLMAAAGYAVVLLWIALSPRVATGPEKGRMAMRTGLPWLLVYDAAFCAAAGRWSGAIAMLVLLGLVVVSSRAMAARSPASPR